MRGESVAEKFTLLIDESGEAGIAKVRSENSGGASPYMTLGAVLIKEENRRCIEETLGRLCSDFGRNELHCSRLNHNQIVKFSKEVAELDVKFFGVISRKETLRDYKKLILSDSGKYYNKCVQYLLERVGLFSRMAGIKAEDIEIIFEEANLNYARMKAFLRACQRNPRHRSTENLKYIDIEGIKSKKKGEEKILQIADLIAHALYRCVDKSKGNYGISEVRYLRELSGNFFVDSDSKKVCGSGLYCVHSVKDLGVDNETSEFINNMKGV